VQSLIIPVGFLLLLGFWGVWENGRKFRSEFKRRGIEWAHAASALARGEGMLIVDTLWGPQRGLGLPVVWWLPEAVPAGADLLPLLQAEARLVNCPKPLKSAAALRGRFSESQVLVHSWDHAPQAQRDTA